MGLSVVAPLSSEPPLCCLKWPLGVRPVTCWRVAVPQALLGLLEAGQAALMLQPGTLSVSLPLLAPHQDACFPARHSFCLRESLQRQLGLRAPRTLLCFQFPPPSASSPACDSSRDNVGGFWRGRRRQAQGTGRHIRDGRPK